MTKAVPASPTLAYLIPGGAFASGQGYYVDRSPRGLDGNSEKVTVNCYWAGGMRPSHALRRLVARLDQLIPTRVKADSFRGFQTGASQTLWGEQEVRHAARDCPSSGL